MKIAGRSDIGLVRSMNQDNYLIAENKGGNTLALVCDGIGGAKAGDVASLLVIKYIGEAFVTTERFNTVASAKLWLEKLLHQANDEVFSKTLTNSDFEGMGTTLVGALFVNDEILISNVGDSRAYVLYNDHLKQITTDHSLVNDLVRTGQIEADDAFSHPQRNILTNALGVVSNLKVDIFNLKHADKILLCSDGLSGYVSKELIFSVLEEDISIEEMLSKLIKAANDAGGYDNTTVIIIDLGGRFSE